jgi:hypothetical protein
MNTRGNGTPTQMEVPVNRLIQPPAGELPMIQVSDLQTAVEIVRAAQLAEAHRPRGRPRLEQPLLILAVGGSAKRIATRLKAAFIERFGELPENVIIRCFDSANEVISVREGRHGRVIALEDKSEFERLERVPVAGIKQAPHYHRAIVERLGPNLQRIPRASIGDGAAQERLQGLLTLLWNAPKVARSIENAVRRLVERSDDLARAAGERSGLNVVLIGSAPGGQGSGALLDLAQLAHMVVRKVGDLEESSRFIGVAPLPGAFAGVRGPNLLPNTHAFFLELNAVMQGAGFQATYPGNIAVNTLEPPFDVVFVLDGIDERRQAFANLDEVCDLAARSLAVLLGTEVGLHEIFAAVNEHGALRGVSAAGYGTFLATIGQASIRFPAQPTADRCVLRLAAEAATASLADAAGATLPGGTLAGAATLCDRLRLNDNGAPFDTRPTVPASLEQAPSEEQPAMARALVTNFLQRRLYETAFTQIRATTGLLSDELRAELLNGLAATQAAGTLATTAHWLRSATEALQTQYATLLAEAERLAATAENNQKGLDAASAALDQAADSLLFLRKGRVRIAVGRYLDEANPYIRLRLEQRITEAAAEATHATLKVARALMQQATDAMQRLEQARILLDGREAELARLAVGHGEINLATPDLVERLYAQYRGAPLGVAKQAASADENQTADRAEGVLAWSRLPVEDLAARLVAAAAPSFNAVREITVEAVLALQWNDRSAQQWISRLADLAAGAWNLDPARLPDGGAAMASFLTIGVPEASGSIFANCGRTLVSTHDPERIVALRTIYGASLDSLKGADDWQQAYEAASQRTPLHVLALPAVETSH